MNRYDQLDSLRGVAALMVFLNHIFFVMPVFTGESQTTNWFVNILRKSPLSIVWAGHEAVLIFFILSGFVLSLAFYGNSQLSYGRFLIKRICRLYIPYITVLFCAIILNQLFYSSVIPNVSSQFNSQWTSDINLSNILAHLLFVGDYDTHAFNPPIWSLIHEMRISIVFPLIMYFILRLKWKSVFLACGMSVIGFVLSVLTGNSNIDYFITIHYASIFILGALLAMYRDLVERWYSRISKAIKAPLLFVVCPLLITYPYWFLKGYPLIHLRVVNDWVSSIGALVLVGAALYSPVFKKILGTRVLKHIGKISYSFYLTHFVVLLTLMYSLTGVLSQWLIFILALAITILVSTFLYNYVEIPSIALGRNLSKPKSVEIVEKKVEVI